MQKAICGKGTLSLPLLGLQLDKSDCPAVVAALYTSYTNATCHCS